MNVVEMNAIEMLCASGEVKGIDVYDDDYAEDDYSTL